jgi:transcriptional regulator with XRE-family HTH domain
MTLGELLRRARKDRSFPVKEVLKHTGLKASASLYSQWENDLKVPTPLDLRVLCQFLTIDLTAAFNLWASAHMPTPALQKIFKDRVPGAGTTGGKLDTDPVAYPAAITKVIAEQDAHWFADNPAAGTLLVRCLMNTILTEKPVTPEKLAKEVGIKTPIATNLCRELSVRKYIIQQGNGFRTPAGIKYLYLPETEGFEEMRRGRIKVNLERTLKAIQPKDVFDRRAVRITVFKKLSPEKVRYFVDSLEAIANEMITVPDSAPDKSNYHQLVCVFGPEIDHG